MHALKLIRPINIVIIAIIMYTMRWGIMHGIDRNIEFHFILSEIQFSLLVLSIALVASAGYIINDYFDIKIDRINKPDKIIIGKYIKRRIAIVMHAAINIFATLIGAWLSYIVGNIWLILFFILSTSILWFYSLVLKRQFLTGNIAISILAAIVPIMPLLYEWEAVQNSYYNSTIVSWILVFSMLSFTTTLIREIIKDMADIKGDLSQKCKTIPIQFGIHKTRTLVSFFILFLMLGLIILRECFLPKAIDALYVYFVIGITLALSVLKLYQGNKSKNFTKSADILKLAMFFALLYPFIHLYLLK